jgi:ATP-dependent helicase/nuclease subunit B
LPRARTGRLPELKDFERRAREAAPARLNRPAPKQAADAIDDPEYDLVTLAEGRGRYLLDVNEAVARSLRTRFRRWEKREWNISDGLVTRDTDTLAALEKYRLNARPWSPSALQEFAVCPYKFALRGILALRPREESSPIQQMDPLTRGGLFHAVQFALLGELRRRELLPVNESRLEEVLQVADRVLNDVAAKYEEDLAPAIPRVWQTEVEDLRIDLRGWLQHIAVNDHEWEPIRFEFAFGLSRSDDRDPHSTEQEAQLDAGVRLRGSIDVVERHVATGRIRVTDHKTGRPPDGIPAFVGGGRFLQPLLYGLAAEQLIGGEVECGRLFYATQQGGYKPVQIDLTDRSRLFLARLLTNIDSAIADGFLPPAPQKDACGICDYRVVCGPYEELRVASHKDRRDERLDGLVEIRGMA